ncbi:MAG: hypothetical protein JO250_15100 [Armatimonadetes bacterium]|nr:hypothetical protein [Armatimonadota bacterium]
MEYFGRLQRGRGGARALFAGEGPASYRIASAVPGRIRVQFASSPTGDADGPLRACAERVGALPEVRATRVSPDARSLIVQYDPRRLTLAAMTGQVAALAAASVPPAPPALIQWAARLVRRIPGQTETIRARDMPTEKPRGLKGLLLPTVAVALAATEAIPLAISGAALAVATIPIYQRAAKGLGKRQLTVDELDLANVALLAVEGSFLPAAGMTWLIALGEWIRGGTVRRARGAARAVPAGETLMDAPLSNTHLQDNAARAGNASSLPLFALGVAYALNSRDVGDFIDVIKPRNDFESAQRLAVPVPVLGGLAREARRGRSVPNGAALERLADASGRASDEARRALTVAKQNTSVAAGASALNLALALLDLSPPPLSNAVNAAAIAAIAANSRRALPPP